MKYLIIVRGITRRDKVRNKAQTTTKMVWALSKNGGEKVKEEHMNSEVEGKTKIKHESKW